MGNLFVACIVLAIVCVVAIVWLLPKKFMAFASLIVLASVVIVMHGCGAKAINDAYAAAAQQNITITVREWWREPVATAPCRVTLKLEGHGKSAKLILPNSGKVATPATLKAVCNTG